MTSLATGSSRNPHGRTAAQRRKTTEEGRCVKRDIVFSKELFDNTSKKPLGMVRQERMAINDCLLKGISMISNAKNDKKAATALLKGKLKGSRDIGYDNLPIYVINAHSSDEFFVELKPPENMSKEDVDEEIQYSYDSQLQEGFTLKSVNDRRRDGFPTSVNFFKTPVNSGVFVIQGAPTGFDARGCPAEKDFRKGIAEAPSETRELLLSPDFKTFLFREDNQYADSIYTPPGYSVINKGYQFWEHDHSSREAWGILCLTDGSVFDEWLGRQPLYYTQDKHKLEDLADAKKESIKARIQARPVKQPYSTTKVTVTDFGDHYVTNFPQLHPRNIGFDDSSPSKHKRIKTLIEDSIMRKSDLSLKKIVETLGPGIYIDMGCASLSLKIWNPNGNNKRGKFDHYSPDLIKKELSSGSSKRVDYDGIQPIYNVVYEDLEIYTHNIAQAWNNITVDLTEALHGNGANNRLAQLKSDPNLQLAMNASRTYADEAYHQRAPNAQRRAHQNRQEYMSMATNYLNRNEFNQLKLPSVNELGSLANHLSVAERTVRRRREKANKGGRRKKTRKKRKKKGGNASGVKFIVKNDEDSIQAFFNSVRDRQNQGMFKNHGWADEEGLEKLESQMMESLLNEEYTDGIYGVTYDAARTDAGIYGHFFSDYFDDENSLIERLPAVSNQNRFPDNLNQLESAVAEPVPYGLRSPNTIMNVNNLQGGKRKTRRRKSTHKHKRNGKKGRRRLKRKGKTRKR